jgi:hypothetical protein
MARAGGMQQVELLDGAPLPEPVPDRQRRWRAWAAGTAAVLVLVLAGTQWVVSSRENAAVARLAAVPGVVPPLGDSLHVVRSISQEEAGSLWGGIETGAGSAILVVGEDGSQAFAAVDERTGDTLWSTTLLGPDPERAAPAGTAYGGTCVAGAPKGQVSTFAACLVTDGFLRIADDGAQSLFPATTTSVRVLDTGDGHVVEQWPVEADTQLAVLAGLVVVGHRDAERGIVIAAHDPRTGDERWRHAEALVEDPTAVVDATTEHFWSFFTAGSVLAFANGPALTLLSPTGVVIRDDLSTVDGGGGYDVDPVTGDLVMTAYASSGDAQTTTLLSADGDPAGDRVLDGRLLDTTVDDGSIPGLVLTALGQLHAWDRETGRERWTADIKPGYGALVVRGRVYLSTASSLVALDGRTGHVDWETPATLGLGGSLATDGRHVLVPSTSSSGVADGGRLIAYDFRTGAEVGRIPYPKGVTDVQMFQGLLLGWSNASAEVSVLE